VDSALSAEELAEELAAAAKLLSDGAILVTAAIAIPGDCDDQRNYLTPLSLRRVQR